MINTLSIAEIEKHADNIYEAIIVIARRARQINGEQKQLIEREDFDDEEYEEFNEERLEQYDSDYVRLPKPTTLALEEFLADRFRFEYRSDSDGEEQSN